MRFYFIVEDSYGAEFIKKLFQKKRDAGLFPGTLKGAQRSPLGPKITRIIMAVFKSNIADRIIILADADGKPIDQKSEMLYRYVSKQYRSCVSVILLDNEIEDWICYSLKIKIAQKKPSDVLREKYGYEKYRLSNYVSKIDCKKLETCSSFQRLTIALRSNT